MLSNVEYQLQLVGALGDGKKDNNYVMLSKAIKEVKISVKAKKKVNLNLINLKVILKNFRKDFFQEQKTQ